MKSIWITSMVSSEDTVKNIFSQIKNYGLEVDGHFWDDNLEKMAWTGAREELIKPDIALWLILTSNEKLNTPFVRYGLSLLTITVQAKRGLSFPIVLLLTEGETPASETLPTPLKNVDFLSLADSGLGAKLVAKVHTGVKELVSEYRLDVYGNQQIGQWFEIGPLNDKWFGSMFGIDEGKILFHGVGPKGSLPSQSTLNYPSEGLRLNLAEREYTAWAVQNELDPQTSYFVKVEGYPESIIFGPYSKQEEAEVYVVKTK